MVDKQKSKVMADKYYNITKLHKTVDKILEPFGGISQKDMDDFYSLANEVFTIAASDFNGTGTFEGFLYSRLSRKIRTMITERNRFKRADVEIIVNEDGEEEKIFHPIMSLDAPTPGNEDCVLADVIPSKFDLEDIVINKNTRSYGDNIDQYLKKLTPLQAEIAKFFMEGKKAPWIKAKLNLSSDRFNRLFCDMKSFEKSIILRNGITREVVKVDRIVCTTLEKSKDEKLSVSAISKKIDNLTIRFDHPLQRASEQWDSKMKGNLISDILQGNPIPEIVLAEQVVNGLSIVWDIDGKQRCSNVHSYKHDGYKISRKVTRGIISYQAIVKDENGRPILDEKGFPKSEKREFDIRNKKFSQLPEELQDKFLEYDFKIVKYLNCSDEEIAYHIARYNSGRPMNVVQKGFTKIGKNIAEMIKSIAAMPFFREYGGYLNSASRNGTYERIIIESVMNINFLDEWVKEQEKMCEFLRDNATEDMFNDFEDMVYEITEYGNDEVFNMFNVKDSFLYFGLYAKFRKLNKPVNEFIGFMEELNRSLHSKKINDVSFDDLEEESTKNKSLVKAKMDLLTKLMSDYFNVQDIEMWNTNNEVDVQEFVKENVDSEITSDDIDFYYDMLNDYRIDKKSKLLEWQNEPSMVAIIAYAFKREVDIDEWIVEYSNRNSGYMLDQKENYIHMRNDLEEYLQHSAA